MKMGVKTILMLFLVFGLNPIVNAQVQTKSQVVEEPFKLTLLHNNDGESQLINAGSGLESYGGVARFKTVVDSLRSRAAQADHQVVMVSSGDNFLAGKEWNASLNRGDTEPYYDVVAMDSINYDAVAIGNHDFDFGPDVLEKFVSDFDVNQPVYLSSNLDFTNEAGLQALVDAGRIAKSTVVEKNGKKIGIIGGIYEDLKFISSPRNTIVSDVKTAIEAEVTELRDNQGVDIIILISHLQDISGDTTLAKELGDIDIVVAGGGDNILANEGDSLVPGDVRQLPYPYVTKDKNGEDVYIVTTGGEYRYVGQLMVEFDADGKVTLVNAESGPVRVDDSYAENNGLNTTVVDPVASFIADLEANVIGTSEVALDGIRDNIRSKETNIGNLSADAILWTAQQQATAFGVNTAQVALQNGGGIRNNSVIPAGDFTEGMTYDILAFTNYVSVIEDMPAAQFKEIMEHSVAALPSTNGRFGQIAGFSMVIDPTRTAQVLEGDNLDVVTPGERVRELTLDDGTEIVKNGMLVQDAPAIQFATIDFLVSQNGDGYPFRGIDFTRVGVTYQQALFNYVVDEDGLNGTITAADYPEGGEGRISENSNFKMTLLHNNDGESQLINAGSGLESFGGVARFKTVVDTLRSRSEKDNSQVVMLSSGDNFLAGKEWNASLNRGEDLPYYDVVAMDAIDYDAVAIGNHDFDFGPDVLEKFISDYQTNIPPYLSANLDFTNETGLQALADDGKIAKSTVVVKDGKKIGIIGATTENLNFISSPRNTIINDVKTAVEAEVADLRDNQGVDIIILISHLQDLSEDTTLAKELGDIDIVVAGGGDNILANEGDLLVPGDVRQFAYPYVTKDKDGKDVYVVTTGGEYRYVGHLMVEFDGDGKVIMVNSESGPVRVDDSYAENTDLKTSVVDPVANFVSALDANVIGTSEVDLDGIRDNVRSKETNIGNLAADAILWTAQQEASAFGVKTAQVALQNGGGIRNNNILAAGDFTEGMTYDILAFTNYVSVIEDMPAAQFKEIMEHSVASLPSTNGRFGQIAGFSMVIDPTQTAQVLNSEDLSVVTPGERVRELVLDNGTVIVRDGALVQDAPAVTFATIDFLVSQNGDGYPFRGINFTRVGVTYQQALYNYVVEEDGLNGTITAADYPEGGEGRIIDVNRPLPMLKARVRPEGAPVVVKGVMTSTDHGFTDGNFFVQDDQAAIFVFYDNFGGETGAPIDFDKGDTLLVYGVIDIFNGIVEVVATDVTLVGAGDQLPEPVMISPDDLTLDSRYQGMRVKLSNVSVTGSNWPTAPQTSSSGRNVTATAGETPFIIRVDRGQSFYDGSPVPVDGFTLVGNLHRFNADVQVMPFFAGDIRSAVKLTILHNNDGESQLVNAGSGLEAFGGVARFKSVVDTLRAHASDRSSEVVMVSSGDNFLAGKEWNASLNRAEGLPFYDVVAMDDLDYDAVSFGNHDFDFGPDVLEKFISDYDVNQAPYVGANLDFTNEPGLKALEDAGRIAKSVVIPRGGRYVGIIGAIYEDLKFISSPRNTIINEVKPAVEAEVAKLKNMGVDMIVLISHLQDVSADTLLAKELTDIDVVVAGGGDNILANEGDSLVPGDVIQGSYPLVVKDMAGQNVYVVTTGGEYRYVGHLALEFDENGVVSMVDPVSGPVRVDNSYPENAEMKAAVVDPVAAFVAGLDANVIAQSEVGLDGIRNNIRSKETNLGNLVADAILWQGQKEAAAYGVKSPQVALQNGGGIRNNNVLAAGDFTEGMTYDILAFTNYVSVVEDMPAAQFKELMENSISRYPTPDGRFGQIAGFTMEFDSAGTAQVLDDNVSVVTPGTRIKTLTLSDGTPIVANYELVNDAPAITMATIDFLVSTNGDQYPFRGIDFTRVGATYQQALYNYVTDEDGLNGTISADDYPESGEGRIVKVTSTSVNGTEGLPTEFSLSQNYPNPFNPTTTIRFALPTRALVTLKVYDVLGREVITLINGQEMNAGFHNQKLDARSLSSGVYFYSIQANDFVSTKKFVLMK